MDRRLFLRTGALALPVVALPACSPSGDGAGAGARASAAGSASDPAFHPDDPARALAPATLAAVAEVVLPSDLGEEGRARAVARFRAWSDGYRPVAEEVHGYGTGELRYTAADPAPGWAAQLRGLEEESRVRAGKAFGDLPLEDRERMLRRQVGGRRGEAGEGLPDVAEARHVALALMTHWFASSEANDVCHGVRIGRETCRPLSASGGRPAELEREVATSPESARANAEV